VARRHTSTNDTIPTAGKLTVLSLSKELTKELRRLTDLLFEKADDLFDATQNLDSFVAVSGALKSCAVSLSKMCSDLRLLSSGPRCGLHEINLPAMQNGSSIMPGKVNPVIPEVVTQVAFLVAGHDTTITMAAEAGRFFHAYLGCSVISRPGRFARKMALPSSAVGQD